MKSLLVLEGERYTQIREYLMYKKKQGKIIALWGAGRKGKIFCDNVDGSGELIDFIFDKDVTKYGKRLITGQKIVDYRDYVDDIDIVLNVMTAFFFETVAALKNSGYHADIINVEDWLLSGYGPDVQMGLMKNNFRQVRTVKIAALIILYQPTPEILDHIASYIGKVDYLYVWDNSIEQHQNLFTNHSIKNKITYICDGKNYGLGYPVNQIANLAANDGIDWLITFDQDSRAGKGMIEAFRKYVESDAVDPLVAIVTPFIDEPIKGQEDKFRTDAPYLSYLRLTIQSGAMQRVDILQQIRYRDELFVDQVDHDYCERVRLAGYHIVRLNHVDLLHQQDAGKFPVKQESGYSFYMGKYSQERYYYQYRNLLYSREWFSKLDPLYAYNCTKALNKLRVMVDCDYESNRHKQAIVCAEQDYKRGILGKWVGGSVSMDRLCWVFKCFWEERIKVSRQQKPFFVWGTGVYGHGLAEILQQIGLQPKAYVDQDRTRWNQIMSGYEIQSPQEILDKIKDADIVLAMRNEIACPLRNTLLKQGRNAYTIQEFFENLLQNKVSILEIGPFRNPLFIGAMVKYLDVLSSENLKKRSESIYGTAGNVPEQIDFVSPNGTWDVVDESFDLIYSAHLLEHQPDLIRHLIHVSEHMNQGGSYVLVIPDKRYCFNFFDPLTTIEDVLAAYYEKRTRHNLLSLFRAANSTHNDAIQHYCGNHGQQTFLTRDRCDSIVADWKRSINGGEYLDVHAWYFTPDSFRQLIGELIHLKFFPFDECEVQDTAPGSNAFFVCLKKNQLDN